MYSGSTRHMYVDFDATGTSSMDWMSQPKIVDSSYTDIITAASPDITEYFGISG